MEEGGHYYTVYYTSLAVGFKPNIAYRHAILAQMPDEVARMDATNMQIKEALGWPEVDFDDSYSPPTVNERMGMDDSLHSIPSNEASDRIKSSKYQQDFTIGRLMEEDATSVDFGLLLHRLGDSFAHSRKDNSSVMYTVTPHSSFNPFNMGFGKNDYGHLAHGHEPDYAFLRQPIFFNYLKVLYEVLFKKVNENNTYKRDNFSARSFPNVKADFVFIFNELERKATAEQIDLQQTVDKYAQDYVKVEISHEMRARMMIEEIRLASIRTMNFDMDKYHPGRDKPYHPEKEDAGSLKQFKEKGLPVSDSELSKSKIIRALEKNVTSVNPKGLFDKPPLPPPDYFIMP